RIQSIWLLLVAAFSAITFRFPFANGDWLKDAVPTSVPLDAKTTIWLSIVTVLAGIIGFITIFLYHDRKLQLRLCYLGTGLTIILLVMYFLEMSQFANSVIALWCVFHFAILACYIMAIRGIRKDEKLIRSMDRLR
ncbi:MAG: DUF4293 domain-containing protein, partial [Flavisolibacter sp.]